MRSGWRVGVLAAVLLVAAAGAEPPHLRVEFTAFSAADSAATAEYEAIWSREGARVVAALEDHTGLVFPDAVIPVIVKEAPSYSGYGDDPMRLRGSYPADTKLATLIHELGHRIQSRYFRKEEDDHPYLFLYLYDVWVALYGSEFADEQVAVEGGYRGLYDYEGAWRVALAMTAEERAAQWGEFLKMVGVE